MNSEVSSNNLNLYIPRVSLSTTEQRVIKMFFEGKIGIVDYCDLVIIKDKETKEPTHMSVFVKLDSWNPLSNHKVIFEKNGSFKLQLRFLNRTEYWIILPNNNPLPRTHVNMSQLAASTEKLFEQQEQIVEKLDRFDNFEEEIRYEMIEMRCLVLQQNQTIAKLQYALDLAVANIAKVTQDNHELRYHQKNSTYDVFGFDTIHEYEVEIEKRKKEIKQPICEEPDNVPPNMSRRESTVVDFHSDDCVFSTIIRNGRNISPTQVLPIQVQCGSPTKSQTLTEIASENHQRAITSRDYCGNL